MIQTDITRKIKEALSPFRNITFAYLFGSYTKETAREGSDVDVGIYFTPRNTPFDIEDEVDFEEEEDIWREIEKKTGKDVDLIVLNRSPATVCSAVLQEGSCIVIRDKVLFWNFFLRVTTLAAEFRTFERDFIKIKRRSLSLNEIDKNRLYRIIDFCTDELSDLKKNDTITAHTYKADRVERRNIERLIENIVNSSIDIAKIILASEKQPIPQTYRETIENLSTIEGFPEDVMETLSSNTRLRNILAHEYLDIKYKWIKRFLSHAYEDYTSLLNIVSGYLQKQ